MMAVTHCVLLVTNWLNKFLRDDGAFFILEEEHTTQVVKPCVCRLRDRSDLVGINKFIRILFPGDDYFRILFHQGNTRSRRTM